MINLYTVPLTSDQVRNIVSALPSGSGFNFDWANSETPNSVRFTTGFQCMNENGYYDGYAQFTIIVPVVDKYLQWGNWSLQFNGSHSQRLNAKYSLREYIEDTIQYAIEAIVDGSQPIGKQK